MNKKFWIIALVLFAICAVNVVFAQSSNNEQRIIGKWKGGYELWGIYGGDESSDNNLVFNSDGTGTFENKKFRYGMSSSKLIIYYEKFNSSVYDYLFSPDGKTLYLYTLEFERAESQKNGMIQVGERLYVFRKN